MTWKIPLKGDVKTNFAGTIGSAMGEKVDPGFMSAGLTNDPKRLQVHTSDTPGKPVVRSFYIAAFRDQ